MAFTQRNMAAGNPPKKGTMISTMETIPGFKKINTPVKKTVAQSKSVSSTPVKKTTASKPVVKTLPEVTVTAKKTTPKVKTLPEVTVTAKKKFSEPYKYFVGKKGEIGGKTEMVSKEEYNAWNGPKVRMETGMDGKPVEGGSGGKTYTNYTVRKTTKKL